MRKRISDFGFRISGELAAESTHARRGMPEILVRLPELATARKNGFRISDFGFRVSWRWLPALTPGGGCRKSSYGCQSWRQPANGGFRISDFGVRVSCRRPQALPPGGGFPGIIVRLPGL